jgi:hypothetical protein
MTWIANTTATSSSGRLTRSGHHLIRVVEVVAAEVVVAVEAMVRAATRGKARDSLHPRGNPRRSNNRLPRGNPHRKDNHLPRGSRLLRDNPRRRDNHPPRDNPRRRGGLLARRRQTRGMTHHRQVSKPVRRRMPRQKISAHPGK